MWRQAMTTIRLPRSMYDDDQSEAIALLKVLRESPRFIWVDSEDPALGELFNYCEYYADADRLDGWDESVGHLGAKARRVLDLLGKAGWTSKRAAEAMVA